MRVASLLRALLSSATLCVLPGLASAEPTEDPFSGDVIDPAVVASLTETGAFAEAVRPVMESLALRRAVIGLQVVRLSDGEEIYAVEADRPLLPASTTKLVTAAAALDALGADFTFNTDVHVEGTIRGGTLTGNLYLQGRADPTLSAERLWRLLRDVQQEGIDRITGDVIFDDSYFDEHWRIPGWDQDEDYDRGVTYYPPVGALASDFGVLSLTVRPGAEVGVPVIVQLGADAPGYVEIVNRALTARDGSRSRVSIERRVTDQKITFVIEGALTMDASPRNDRRTMSDPTAYTMAVVKGLMADIGIQVAGTFRRGEVPVTGVRQLRRLYSPPLASVLMDTNKYSSNYMAEMVLRTLGAEKEGQGTTEAGIRVVQAYLDRIGVPRTDYQLRNGSGLSRETEIAPSVLTAVLLDMSHDAQVGPEFIASLSLAGQDGTLESRMMDLVGQIRGKTGTLGGVHCLIGYAVDGDGERYAFAFLVNEIHGSIDAVKAVQDDFLRELVGMGRGALGG